MEFPFLFSPITINTMELKNRIVMPAMHLGYSEGGEVNDRLIDFYAMRARGGAGLIIVGTCSIDDDSGMPNMMTVKDDRYIPGLARLAAVVRQGGAKCAAQIVHQGASVFSAFIGGRQAVSASAVQTTMTRETPRALTLDEIPLIQDKYAQAASRVKEAGFDAVEILGGYLPAQFLSPLSNIRDDEYGGSLAGRMRFCLEVAAKVRDAVGADFPVLMRLSGNEFVEGGFTREEVITFASELEKTGVDMLNVTGGRHETKVPQITMFVPRRTFVYLAQGIKSAVSIPVMASNRINDPAIAEEIIRNGEADLVAMARAHVADPELANKAGAGKSHLIYHCIGCTQGCIDNGFRLQPVTCLVNPRSGMEGEHQAAPAPHPKKVLVIGGGPAGMKAAITAAERGHKVTLIEKSNRLGGQLLLNRMIPGRQEMLTAAQDLINNLRNLDVKILLGQEADVRLVKEMAPDAVVIATGAKPIMPDLPGIEGNNVVNAWDLLEGKVSVGKKVIVVGGNAVGLETALYLCEQGTLSPESFHFLAVHRAEPMETLLELLNKGVKEVTVVEMADKLGLDIGPSSRWTVISELKRLGCSFHKGVKATGITPEGLEIEGAEGPGFLPADSIIIAVGSRSDNKLTNDLEGLFPELHTIGDAKEPRNAMDAIREGFFAGLKI
jgi:2,4-dienoyl-CoA reductase (NADPH2)